MDNSITVPKKELFQIIKYKIFMDVFVSLLMLAFIFFIAFLLISGKGHFELRSSLWIIPITIAGSYFIYNTILLFVDCYLATACVLECKKVNMVLGDHKSSYYIDYTDNNDQSGKIILTAAEKRNKFRFFILEAPVKIFYTKRTKVFIGYEVNGKVTWLLGKK